jgi:hypothetical protein
MSGAKQHELSRNSFEDVAAFECGLSDSNHHDTGKFPPTFRGLHASDRRRKGLHCVVNSVVLFLGVLERVQHTWVLRLAYLQRAKKAGWLITFEVGFSTNDSVINLP